MLSLNALMKIEAIIGYRIIELLFIEFYFQLIEILKYRYAILRKKLL